MKEQSHEAICMPLVPSLPTAAGTLTTITIQSPFPSQPNEFEFVAPIDESPSPSESMCVSESTLVPGTPDVVPAQHQCYSTDQRSARVHFRSPLTSVKLITPDNSADMVGRSTIGSSTVDINDDNIDDNIDDSSASLTLTRIAWNNGRQPVDALLITDDEPLPQRTDVSCIACTAVDNLKDLITCASCTGNWHRTCAQLDSIVKEKRMSVPVTNTTTTTWTCYRCEHGLVNLLEVNHSINEWLQSTVDKLHLTSIDAAFHHFQVLLLSLRPSHGCMSDVTTLLMHDPFAAGKSLLPYHADYTSSQLTGDLNDGAINLTLFGMHQWIGHTASTWILPSSFIGQDGNGD
jgi:hypothetical protein